MSSNLKKVSSLFSGLGVFIKSRLKQAIFNEDTRLMAVGTMLSNQQYSMNSIDINDYEFKIFSQWGDDGVIQFLIKNLKIENETFIEFGVEDYLESNTRFLMMHNYWSGYILDGSEKAMRNLKKQKWYWKYTLKGKTAFIDRENINGLLSESGLTNIGILSIDIDGNDYYILEALNFTKLNPSILILEYNAVFGNERPISVPYAADFIRNNAHYSNLYFGASLPALNYMARKKGYTLIGCTRAGNNAYFVKNELLTDKVVEKSVKEAFKQSKFRESRNKDYSLSYLTGDKRLDVLKGLKVINVESGEEEVL